MNYRENELRRGMNAVDATGTGRESTRMDGAKLALSEAVDVTSELLQRLAALIDRLDGLTPANTPRDMMKLTGPPTPVSAGHFQDLEGTISRLRTTNDVFRELLDRSSALI